MKRKSLSFEQEEEINVISRDFELINATERKCGASEKKMSNPNPDKLLNAW